MRQATWTEKGIWAAGIALVGLYVAERLDAERARIANVDAFRAAAVQTLAQADEVARPAESAAHARAVDQSLWSAQRIAAFAESASEPDGPNGVLSIPALALDVPVYAGTDEETLNRGAGHIEGTSPIAPSGNIGIAAHRDSYFRGLKDIAIDDEIRIELPRDALVYRVVDISIVAPSDVHVLAPTEVPSLTLVTCYPFYFVGPAPERYIVRAELVPEFPPRHSDATRL